MTEIIDYINNDDKAIDGQQTIEALQDFFIDVPYSHFAVLNDGIYIGCIAAADVETFDTDKKVMDYKYALEGFFARDTMIWLDVLEVFAKITPILFPY